MDCATSQAPWLPYKYRSLCGGAMLPTFALSLAESEFAHDEASGLVITAWGLSGDREPTFGVDGLPLVGVVFFHSSSLVGVVLFPSYTQ